MPSGRKRCLNKKYVKTPADRKRQRPGKTLKRQGKIRLRKTKIRSKRETDEQALPSDQNDPGRKTPRIVWSEPIFSIQADGFSFRLVRTRFFFRPAPKRIKILNPVHPPYSLSKAKAARHGKGKELLHRIVGTAVHSIVRISRS